MLVQKIENKKKLIHQKKIIYIVGYFCRDVATNDICEYRNV